MLLSQALDNYVKEYPIYGSIKFSKYINAESENLHPLYILTQYIIDCFIRSGSNRVAVVLPDNDCNIIPLLLTKYFANMQFEQNYAGSVLDEIKSGQHLRLGKAVVEFLGINEQKQIKFRVDRKNSTTLTCPINGIHYMFEKTEGAVSSLKTWREAERIANQKLTSSNGVLDELRIKRTALRKTMLLLSVKNDFRDFTESLYINGISGEEVVTYGEIDLESEDKFKLYNKGRLDCLPSISVTTKMEELYYLLKDEKNREKIYSIYSSMDKFDEIISNPDTFKKILKYQIPFVAFVSENDFEGCPLLTDFGFELWHWKPSTMQSEAFLSKEENKIGNRSSKEGFFGNFSKKIGKAALSEFTLKTVNDPYLKKSVQLISRLSKESKDADNVIRQLIRKIWGLQNKLTYWVCKIEGIGLEALQQELKEISDIWHLQKNFYTGQQTEALFDEILKIFGAFFEKNAPGKFMELLKFIENIASSGKSITVVVPNKYIYIEQTFNDLSAVKSNCFLKIRKLADFYNEQNKGFAGIDYLVLTWFDKDEYIKIKQTYCYNNLVFILYDYENRWREAFIAKIDECIPHELIKNTARKVQFSENDIADTPFDKIETKADSDFDEISDYTLSSKIIRSTFENQASNKYVDDSIECIPVLLSEDKIAYFYPTHDLIDVTFLTANYMDRPVKKDAAILKKGDKILVRQSGKDIIKEQADLLMQQAGELSLRDSSELWVEILKKFAEGKTIKEVCDSLNKAGGECSFQQVVYWLLGSTIMPRDINVLKAIGRVVLQENSSDETGRKYSVLIDKIFEDGKKVQSYHQKAGRRLTSELKNKAAEIKAIADKIPSRGVIEGIGEIAIYTVEDILDKEQVGRNLVNRIEELY